MKINELLNESDNEQLDEFLGTALGLAARGAGALLKGSKTGKQTIQAVGSRVAPTMAGSTTKADHVLQRAGIDTTNSWLNSKWRDILAWQIQRKGMKAFKASQAAAYENGKIAANFVSDLGLKGFGLATLAYDLTSYYQTRQALQEKYADDPDKLDQALTELNVTTVGSIIAPRVIGSLGKMTSNVVGAIVGKVAGPRAGAVTKFWGGILAKTGEAGAMALFRTTDAGKKWLTDALSFVTLGIGSATALIKDFMELFGAIVDVGKDIAGVLGIGSGAGTDLISIGKAAMSGKSGEDAWTPSKLDKEPEPSK